MTVPDISLDLRFLKYALLVAEHGSFRRAADRHNLSQSTLSRRVQLLERRLGVELFERTRTGTKPTAVGERFMRQAAVGAEHLRDAINEMRQVQRGEWGELKIGLVASLAQGMLGDILEAYRCRFPKVDVKLEEASSQANAASVLNGRIDVAFIPGEPRLSGCEVRPMWKEELFVAVPTHHRLSKRETLSWEELRDEIFLVTHDVHGPEAEGIIARKVSGLGFQPRISVQRLGRENLINMVGRGYGVTLAASSTLGAAYSGVTFLPIGGGDERISWSAVWTIGNQSPVLKQLLNVGATVVNRR
ncbi:LysR family transcriptional regulator [Mesorhizobium xinjiangense]|uniref:LysR substrate-binding domain-containing protein n=1 Tax=Mesorhizobium xinjiangense TaxID=2678685 RepID=UPI001F483B94|nr:LysR family transcriptional regulator [Mesorhizobium xinjiangense]